MEKETRHFEIRAVADDGAPALEGYAARFGSLSEDLGGFREKIRRGAFAKTLKENKDVRALFDHDSKFVLGRTPDTLSLEENTVGLKMRVVPPETTWAADLLKSVARGDISQMSFGFYVVTDKWDKGEDDMAIRTLEEIQLIEVSIVTFPAYPETSVAVRSLEQWRGGGKNAGGLLPSGDPAASGGAFVLSDETRRLIDRVKQLSERI